MKELPEDFEEKYLELIEPYQSEETMKTRRNLMVASFIIVALSYVGIPLEKIRLFATDLQGADLRAIYIVAFAIIGYWSVVFIFLWFRDREMQKERSTLLLKLVNDIGTRISDEDKEIDDLLRRGQAVPGTKHHQLDVMKSYYKKYTDQIGRTSRARQLTNTARRVIDWLPVMLAFVAVSILINDLA